MFYPLPGWQHMLHCPAHCTPLRKGNPGIPPSPRPGAGVRVAGARVNRARARPPLRVRRGWHACARCRAWPAASPESLLHIPHPTRPPARVEHNAHASDNHTRHLHLLPHAAHATCARRRRVVRARPRSQTSSRSSSVSRSGAGRQAAAGSCCRAAGSDCMLAGCAEWNGGLGGGEGDEPRMGVGGFTPCGMRLSRRTVEGYGGGRFASPQ